MTRENELLRKILRGENEYWEELIGMYYEDIYRYCIYHKYRYFLWYLACERLQDDHLAEDAVQETFLKVIRYFPNYRDRGKFRAFLYKVASNVCTDQWRKCREEEIPEDTVYLETGYARSEDDIRFLERVRALPEELREIVYLKYAQELTMREIAKVLNIPMRTVQSKLRRALGILKCEEERAWGRKNGLKLNSLFLIF